MPETPSHLPGTRGSRRAAAWRLGAVIVGAAVATALAAGPALADPPSSSGTTTANVDVSSMIALTGLTSSFTLSGIPGDTPADDGAVTMNVLTNNADGYNVTVEAASADLSDTAGNSIPVADLQVNNGFVGGTAGWLPLSNTATTTVFDQATPSADGGDTVTNDYQLTIPNVPNGTYSATLDYVATTNP